MVKKLIDIFPDDFASAGSGTMAGMKKKKKKKKTRMTHPHK
jgi:hypothetical protein